MPLWSMKSLAWEASLFILLIPLSSAESMFLQVCSFEAFEAKEV